LPIVTVDVAYDAYVDFYDASYLRYFNTSGLLDGYWQEKGVANHHYRSALRFPLTDLPADKTVTQVRLKVRVLIAGGETHLTDVHPYNGDGQADPEADTDANFYSRCASGGAYVDDSTLLRTTGDKWFVLGAQACTDVANAKAAVDRFSVGLHEEGDNDANATLEALEHVDPNHAQLEITYEEEAPPPSGGVLVQIM